MPAPRLWQHHTCAGGDRLPSPKVRGGHGARSWEVSLHPLRSHSKPAGRAIQAPVQAGGGHHVGHQDTQPASQTPQQVTPVTVQGDAGGHPHGHTAPPAPKTCLQQTPSDSGPRSEPDRARSRSPRANGPVSPIHKDLFGMFLGKDNLLKLCSGLVTRSSHLEAGCSPRSCSVLRTPRPCAYRAGRPLPTADTSRKDRTRKLARADAERTRAGSRRGAGRRGTALPPHRTVRAAKDRQ